MRDVRVFVSRRDRDSTLRWLAVLAVVLAVAFAVSVATYLNRERIRGWLATGASATPRP